MEVFDEARSFVERRKAATYAVAGHIGKRMETEAKQRASWEDRTGHARQGIQGGADRRGGDVVVYLAHTAQYGIYLELGTGIYGPKKRPITPKRKKLLVFPVGGGKYVAARSVKGMKPRPVINPTAKRNIPVLQKAIRDVWRDA